MDVSWTCRGRVSGRRASQLAREADRWLEANGERWAALQSRLLQRDYAPEALARAATRRRCGVRLHPRVWPCSGALLPRGLLSPHRLSSSGGAAARTAGAAEAAGAAAGARLGPQDERVARQGVRLAARDGRVCRATRAGGRGARGERRRGGGGGRAGAVPESDARLARGAARLAAALSTAVVAESPTAAARAEGRRRVAAARSRT